MTPTDPRLRGDSVDRTAAADGGLGAAPETRPGPGAVLRSVLLRAVIPALVMFGVLLGVGKLLMTVFHEVPSEEKISQDVAAERVGVLDDVTKMVSTANDTWFTIGGAILAGLLVLALTRKWWLGIVPVLAITLEASVFVPVTKIVNRPRPEVGKLDQAPPTSSFPSGHTAASFALFWSLMLLAHRIPNAAVRRAVQVMCLVFPFGVGAARLYRGMHHLSDILLGMGLGIVCAVAAYRSIRAAEKAAQKSAGRGLNRV